MLMARICFAKGAALAFTGACLLFLGLCATAKEPGHMELEWSALVPANWEAPLILPAPGTDGHYPVNPDSLVQELDGQRVGLPGYMIPVRFEKNVVSQFLFVPYLGHHAQSHAHYDANQMVYVTLLEPVTVLDPFSAWFVKGLLRVASVTTEDGRTGYTLEQARAENYIAEVHDKGAQEQSHH